MAEKKGIVVAGWTDWDTDLFPPAEINNEVFDAVVKEVSERNYLFGGDSHQEMSGCCPVISDGTLARFSHRGWGAVIAAAYDRRGRDGKLDIMAGYMDEMIKESAVRQPHRYIDWDIIEDKEERKHYRLPLPFSQNFTASKDFDYRAEDDITRKIKKYDFVDFEDMEYADENGNGILAHRGRVVGIYRAATFEELFKILEEEDVMFYDDSDFSGYDRGLSREELLAKLYEDFPRTLVEKEGVVCIRSKDIRYSNC